MFGRNQNLFRIAGIDVQVNVSWLILALIVAWALANEYFPEIYGDWTSATYWLTAVFGVIGLACSLIIHELAHSIVARAYGLELRSITLFVFGGVAQVESEPRTAKTELLMAIAGPAASLALAVALGAAYQIGVWSAWPEPIVALSRYLGLLNLALGVFNLVPAFPMDGGRILRSLLWSWWGDLRAATQWASRVGMWFGMALMTFGLGLLLIGAVGAGFWWLLMGLFLRAIAESSITELDVRRVAADLAVGSLVAPGSAPVDASTTVATVVEDRMLRLHVDTVPVVDGSRLLGLVSVSDVRKVPVEARSETPVEKLARPCPAGTEIDAETNAAEALTLMRKAGSTCLVVRQYGTVIGVLSLDDLLQSISLRLELEGPSPSPPKRYRSPGKAATLGA